jgi:competence protein ComEA
LKSNISKKTIKEFFSYSRSELRGIIVLSTLILSLLCVRIYITSGDNKVQFCFSKAGPDKTGLVQNISQNDGSIKKSNNIGYDIKLVHFDPNIAGYGELTNLGISGTMARNILKYREKGGRFVHSDDLLKIYGMDTNLYNRLQPFICIKNEAGHYNQNKNQFKDYSQLKININEADTLELKKIPGIGPVLSRRIIKYRQLLGGFNNIDQLKEVYGINDSLLSTIEQYLISDTIILTLININTCTIGELEKHPYINHYQAKAIESYRKLVGPFKDKKQLLENYLLSDENYQKVSPYLTLN